MPLTYSNNLRLTNIGNGEQSGTWGELTNINIGTLVEQAISGYVNVSITDSALGYTLTTLSGAVDEARAMGLNITSSVTLTATRNVIVPTVGSPPTSAPYTKLYVVRNATSGGQSIVIKTSAGTGITVANLATAIVLCNGTDVIDPFSSKQAALGYTPVNKAGDTMTGSLRVTNATDGYTLFATTGADPFGTNYDRFQIGLDTSQQKTYVGNYQGGSGSARALELVVGAVSRLRINTDGSFGFYNNSGTKTANLDASGNLVVLGNVTAYGTP
jgi:hypothetical protein